MRKKDSWYPINCVDCGCTMFGVRKSSGALGLFCKQCVYVIGMENCEDGRVVTVPPKPPKRKRVNNVGSN